MNKGKKNTTQEISLRFNEGKRQWSLVDFESIAEMVKVLEFGCKKYDRNNWQKGLVKSETIDSAFRHLVEINNNNEMDDESKCLHAAHVMCNMMFYIYHLNNKSFVEKAKEL